MATRHHVFVVTCPSGTLATAPVEIPLAFASAVVEKISIVIPDGHAGLTGIALAVAHQPVVPFDTGTFFAGNDEVIPLLLDDYPDSGAWSAFLYNDDTQSHSWQVRFAVNEVAGVTPAETPVAPLALTPTGVDLGTGAVTTDLLGVTPADVGTLDTSTTTDLTGPAVDLASTPTDVTTGDLTPPDLSTLSPGDQPPPEDFGPTLDDTQLPPQDAAPPPSDVSMPSSTGPPVPSARALARQGPVVHPHTLQRPINGVVYGWLPAHARFTLRQSDQGNDFITDWRGRIVAPGPGVVVAVLSDRPFPAGFGPRYPVVRVDSGDWAGTWYLGHTTAQVRAGQRFRPGQTLSLADQGHVDGGGWVELGAAPGGLPGPLGAGAPLRKLFTPGRVISRPGQRRQAMPPVARPAPRGPLRKPAVLPLPGQRQPGRKAPTPVATGGGGRQGAARRPPAPPPLTPPRQPAAPPRSAPRRPPPSARGRR